MPSVDLPAPGIIMDLLPLLTNRYEASKVELGGLSYVQAVTISASKAGLRPKLLMEILPVIGLPLSTVALKVLIPTHGLSCTNIMRSLSVRLRCPVITASWAALE